MKDDLILSLETATRGGSVALMRGGSLLASSIGIAEESHSTNLLSRIESLLNEANVSLRDVAIFATAAGPGSFTGLRIGLATMKAFAAVFNRPCIGVPTLEVIAFAAGEFECTYALLPAGRGEVFAWERSQARSQEHIPPQVLLERINEPRSIHWAGPGAHLYKDLIRQRAAQLGIEFGRTPSVSAGASTRAGTGASASAADQSLWTLAPNIDQLAEYVAILALQRANDGNEYKPEDLRAIYVRPSDAEMKSF